MVLSWHSVFAIHLQHHPKLQWVLNLGGMAWSGVDLFFVLSGFLIGGILLDVCESPSYYQTFYARRAYRILPLYFAVLLLCWLVSKASFAAWIDPVWTRLFNGQVPLWSFLTFTQNIVMATSSKITGGAPAVTWSLAIEEQFYLAPPFLVRNVSRNRIAYVVLSFVLAAPLIRFVLVRFYSEGAYSSYFLTPCRADALGLGVLCALLVRNARTWAWMNLYRSWLYCLAGFLALGLLGLLVNNYSLLTSPIYGLECSMLALFYASLLLLAITRRDVIIEMLLCSRIMMGLGTVAYGTYLFHNVLLVVFKNLGEVLHLTPTPIVIIGIPQLAIAVSIVVAHLSWRFFEKPLIHYGHRHKY